MLLESQITARLISRATGPSHPTNTIRSDILASPMSRRLGAISRRRETNILESNIEARMHCRAADGCCLVIRRQCVPSEIDESDIRDLHFRCPSIRAVISIVLGDIWTYSGSLDPEIFEAEVLYYAPV